MNIYSELRSQLPRCIVPHYCVTLGASAKEAIWDKFYTV